MNQGLKVALMVNSADIPSAVSAIKDDAADFMPDLILASSSDTKTAQKLQSLFKGSGKQVAIRTYQGLSNDLFYEIDDTSNASIIRNLLKQQNERMHTRIVVISDAVSLAQAAHELTGRTPVWGSARVAFVSSQVKRPDTWRHFADDKNKSHLLINLPG